MMGLGLVLREGMEWNEDGSPHTIDHWDYKAPVAADCPPRFNVSYAKNTKNVKVETACVSTP
jgi:CO/xanthine dehydrogenase Mo-binding subunit